MNELVVGLGALGLLLVFQGVTAPEDRSRSTVASKIETLLAEAGVHMPTTRAVGVWITSIVGALLVSALVVVSPVVSLVAAVGGAWLPVAYVRARRVRRRRKLREAWPDALAALISAIRSGASLAEACSSLAMRGPDELKPGFAAFRDTYRATGNLTASLERLAQLLSDPIADRVIASLHVAHQVGGTDLVRVLRTLSDFVRDDLRTRREIEARWSWTVTAARVAAAAPWIVLVLMSTRPEAAHAYNSATGAVVVVGGAVATAVGYRLMLRAARLPDDRRLR